MEKCLCLYVRNWYFVFKNWNWRKWIWRMLLVNNWLFSTLYIRFYIQWSKFLKSVWGLILKENPVKMLGSSPILEKSCLNPHIWEATVMWGRWSKKCFSYMNTVFVRLPDWYKIWNIVILLWVRKWEISFHQEYYCLHDSDIPIFLPTLGLEWR